MNHEAWQNVAILCSALTNLCLAISLFLHNFLKKH